MTGEASRPFEIGIFTFGEIIPVIGRETASRPEATISS